MSRRKNDRDEKRHFRGVGAGLILVFVIYSLLGYRSLSKANQNTEPQSSMLAVSNSYEPSLDDIGFVEWQLSAVTIDMYRYLGWFPNEKEMLKKASVKAISDLKTLKDYLRQLSFTGDLIELKDMHLALIDTLAKIYDGIELKSTDDIEKAFAEFNGLYSQYCPKLREAIKKYKPVVKLPEDFDLKEQEIKSVQNQKDRESYLNAVELIKERKFNQAYRDLVNLRGKYKDTIFESCILLKRSDCLYRADYDEGRGIFAPGKSLELLSDILDAGEYSPVLYKAFYRWRTVMQVFWGGMSNTSKILNWEYNLKKWQAIQTVKQYLKAKPNDIWAKAQMNLLLSLPNIGRGGLMGNDNLNHWGMLYMDIEPDKNK